MFAGTVLLALSGVSFLATGAKVAEAKLDANHLKTGRFLYRTLLNGKDAGNSNISIRKIPGSSNLIYTNHVTGQFSQQWEAIAAPTFVPISAKLIFGEGDHAHPAFELKYQGGRVTGFAFVKQPSNASGKIKVDVDVEVLPDTVDQRIDWAAVMAQEMAPGREFEFHVFDPGAGNSRVTGRIVGPETVHVPAGTFAAMRIVYRIEKAGGTEIYQVLTKRTGLKVLLKEEFPDGAVTELVEAKD